MGVTPSRSRSNTLKDAPLPQKLVVDGPDMMDFIPMEILLYILTFLEGEDLGNSRQVCKLWNQLVMESSLLRRETMTWSSKITTQDVKNYISKNPDVESLNLTPFRNYYADVQSILSSTRNLKKLYINYFNLGTPITTLLTTHLSKLTTLMVIGIDWEEKVAKFIHQLLHLEVLGCSPRTSLKLSLTKLYELVVDIDSSNSTVFATGGVKVSLNCPSLRMIDLQSSSRALVVEDVKSVLQSCIDLRSIRLINVSRPIDNFLETISTNFPNLTSLDLSHGISDNFTNLMTLFRSCSKLRSVRVGLTTATDSLTVIDLPNVEYLHISNIGHMEHLELITPKLRKFYLICCNTKTLTIHSNLLIIFSLQFARALEMDSITRILETNDIRQFDLSGETTLTSPMLAFILDNYVPHVQELTISNGSREVVDILIKLSKQNLRKLNLSSPTFMVLGLLQLLLEKSSFQKVRLSGSLNIDQEVYAKLRKKTFAILK